LVADLVRYELAYDLVNKAVSGNAEDNREALRYLTRLKQDTYLELERLSRAEIDSTGVE
jgi:hypothetical protein